MTEPIEFLTGEDYPDLCEYCQKTIDMMAEHLHNFGPDTDDTERPMMRAYDYRMLCGGNFCEKPRRVE